MFANLAFRFYSCEQIFADLRQFTVRYLTFGTGSYKISDKGGFIFLNVLFIYSLINVKVGHYNSKLQQTVGG